MFVYEVMMGEWRPGLHLPPRVAHGRPFRPFFSYPEQSHVKYSRAKPFFSIVSTPGYPLPGEPESNVASLADKVSPVLGHKRPGPPSVEDFIGYPIYFAPELLALGTHTPPMHSSVGFLLRFEVPPKS